MLLAALVAEGPITIEIQKPGGGPVRRKTIRGQQAAAHQLLIAIQQVARQAQKNPMAVLRLLELIGQEVDGRPMAAGTDTTQRSTTFVYETSEPGASGPSSVADVVVGDEPPEDEGFERVEG